MTQLLPTARSASRRDLQRVRQRFERRGAIGIKLGQFLALRPDILPQEYCDELLLMADRAPTFSWQIAKRIITEDLGSELENLFAWVDPSPVAAASLAQVHMGFTHEGERVAIKVQREGLREQIDKQLSHARSLRRLLAAIGGTLVSPGELVAELRNWLDQELDFKGELRNLSMMYESHKRDEHIKIPRPYPELSGQRVITSEFVRGVSFATLLSLVRRGEAERIKELGFDRKALAESLMSSTLKQIFADQRFHADPHPGNLIALPGNAIGFIDFGLVSELDDATRQIITRYLTAVYSGDIERMHHALTQLLIPGPKANAEAFHDAFIRRTRGFLRERKREEDGYAGERSPFARYLVDLLQTARENDFRLPSETLAMYRALLTTEMIAQELGDRINVGEIGKRFFSNLQFRSTLQALEPQRLQSLGLDTLALVQDGPGLVHRVLSDLADDRFLINVRAEQSQESKAAANRRAMLTSASLLSVTLAILFVSVERIPWLPSQPTTQILGGSLILIFIWIMLLWKRLI